MLKGKYTKTGSSIIVVLSGKTTTVRKGAVNFERLGEALDADQWDRVPQLLDTKGTVKDWAGGLFDVRGDNILYDGEQLPNELTKRILAMVRAGSDPQPWVNFWARLMRNPSWRSVKQLFPFMAHAGIPILPDGCFLAYKSVTRGYLDHHSKKIDNHPGRTIKEKRNRISDDPTHACHFGLHVGALGYANTFGSDRRIIICKIDPENVVCVPNDSSQQKMRVCEYFVIGEHPGKLLPNTNMVITEEDLLPKQVATVKAQPKKIKIKIDPVQPKKDPGATVSHSYDDMDEEALMSQSIADLRKYAAGALSIKGASKLPGGKAVLVPRIMYHRRRVSGPFAPFNILDFEGLMSQSIADLRKYAAANLSIVGASKMSGGKVALASRILQVRDED